MQASCLEFGAPIPESTVESNPDPQKFVKSVSTFMVVCFASPVVTIATSKAVKDVEG